jgi:antirestriction protein ArdC
VHSTGHNSRLNRKTLEEVSSFGSVEYSKEELVAEIGSMYLTGLLGIECEDTMENSQAYIKGWCKHLREAKDECIYAMQQATKAVNYIKEGKAVNIN